MATPRLLPRSEDSRLNFKPLLPAQHGGKRAPREKVVLFPNRKEAVLVQVEGRQDVASSSALEQVDTLEAKREAREKERAKQEHGRERAVEGDPDVPLDDDSRFFKRAASGGMRLKLSDGHNTVHAFELKKIQGLGLEELKLGCKLLVWNVRVSRGILMLSPESCVVKGHVIDELDANAETDLEDSLRQRLGLDPLDRGHQVASADENAPSDVKPVAPPSDPDDIIFDDGDNFDIDAFEAIEEVEKAAVARKPAPQSSASKAEIEPIAIAAGGDGVGPARKIPRVGAGARSGPVEEVILLSD